MEIKWAVFALIGILLVVLCIWLAVRDCSELWISHNERRQYRVRAFDMTSNGKVSARKLSDITSRFRL